MIISIFNNKGGSSKTTINFQLATYLSSIKNKNNPDKFNKVLLIDLDEQINLTTTILKKETTENTIDKLIINDMFIEEGILTPLTNYPNLDFIPGGRSLKTFDLFLNTKKVANETVIKKYFKKNQKTISEYDYVILDLGPSTNLVNLNAFLTLDKIIIPLYFSMIDSIKGASAFINSYKSDIEELEIEKTADIVCFINAYKNKDSKISRSFFEELDKAKNLQNIILDSKIKESDIIKNATIEVLSIKDYITKNNIIKKSILEQFNDFIEELLRKEIL